MIKNMQHIKYTKFGIKFFIIYIFVINFIPISCRSEDQFTNLVTLRGLNKITANTSILEVPIGSSFIFGNLEIIPRLCWKSPPEERLESKALLEIYEIQEERKMIFFGWMIASNPGISVLENPVYDISLIECNHSAPK